VAHLPPWCGEAERYYAITPALRTRDQHAVQRAIQATLASVPERADAGFRGHLHLVRWASAYSSLRRSYAETLSLPEGDPRLRAGGLFHRVRFRVLAAEVRVVPVAGATRSSSVDGHHILVGFQAQARGEHVSQTHGTTSRLRRGVRQVGAQVLQLASPPLLAPRRPRCLGCDTRSQAGSDSGK
jgi:hypothetical protein